MRNLEKQFPSSASQASSLKQILHLILTNLHILLGMKTAQRWIGINSIVYMKIITKSGKDLNEI